MAKYAANDMIERASVVWAFILAMLWGNNAPDLFDPDAPTYLTISIYLVCRGSVLGCECNYAIFIHHIRRRLVFQSSFIFPVVPIWIVAIYKNGNVRVGLMFAAVNIENVTGFLIDTPLITNRFLDENDRREVRCRSLDRADQ